MDGEINMSLEIDFKLLLDEYEKTLTAEQLKNYFPIIRKSFFPYLLKHYSNKIDDSEYLLNSVLTCEQIIDAGVYYVDNTKKVTNIAAVQKYLSAVGELCRRIIFKKHPNSILKSIVDFQPLCDDIAERAVKELQRKTVYANLSDSDYEKLNQYLNSLDDSQYKQQITIAVFRMILLFGFKIGIIAAIKRDDYDEQRNILKVHSEDGQDNFRIELPFLLSKQIEKIKKCDQFGSEYLFLSENGQSLSSDYFDNALRNISKEIHAAKKITTTGLSKFAVVNMFLEGMNPITISQITGVKDVQMKYCQRVAYDKTKGDTNRYINSKLRNIPTYDDFNF